MTSFRPRTWLRTRAGSLADRLFPDLVGAAEQADAPGRFRVLRQLIIFSRLQQGLQANDSAGIEAAQGQFWRSDAYDDFYDETAERNESWFLNHHQDIVKAMGSQCARASYDRLIEIGCGNGFVLEHLAGKLPIHQLIGLDINPRIIARNTARHRDNPRLRFQDGDAQSLLPSLLGDRSLLLSYGGVLEYFAPESVMAIYRMLAATPGSAMALVEPIDPAHDLANDAASHIFGDEHSFSHNHAALLKAVGIAVVWQRELQVDGVRWLMLIGVSRTT